MPNVRAGGLAERLRGTELGSDFQRGTTYSVTVNDKSTSFVAQ